MLKELKRLSALGFSCHLLREKSKAPIENGWSRGPSKTFAQLKADFKSGMNIGVRLGTASKVGAGHLAVIDCDIKSREKKHIEEMEEKLFELFGESISDTPRVASGRGNGSRHYYIVTAAPAESHRLAQAFDRVEVHMPSVKPSKADIERLSTLKIQQGIRMRPAWEISLMGEGSQVVLPPSVHPDSGRAYIWSKPCLTGDELALIEVAPRLIKNSAPKATQGNFKPEEVDLEFSGLSKKLCQLIIEGEGTSNDKSADAFSACLAMASAGFTENQILSVLTESEYYLGEIGFRHTGSTDRARAAEWVRKYCLHKAKRAVNGAAAFEAVEDLGEGDRALSAEEAAKQAKEITGETWQSRLDRTKNGKLAPTFKTVEIILEQTIGKTLFKQDEFYGLQIHGLENPWKTPVGEEVKDIDLINMKGWFAHQWGIEPNQNLLIEVIRSIAHKNKFHPVKAWLATLPPWDGVERVEHWMHQYLNAEGPVEYIKAVSRIIPVAMIARVFQPGVKFDCVPILHGIQGIKKSTIVERLASPWGSDAQLNMADKDGVLALRGAWILELGELSGMSRAEINQVKEFVSRKVDRVRLPYGKLTESFPRQSIFIGTTNQDEFLRDETGNRRFWPVRVGECDPDGLMLVRDQLFAEALLLYELGEPLYLKNKAALEGSAQEQMLHSESDMLEEQLQKIFQNPDLDFDPKRFKMSELFDSQISLLKLKDDRANQLRIGKALKRLGGRRRVTKSVDRKSVRMWVFPSTTREE